MDSITAKKTQNDLEVFFNHVVLPPQLPKWEDTDVDRTAASLLSLVANATETFRQSAADQYYFELSLVLQSLSNCNRVCFNGTLNKQLLLEQLWKLERQEQLIVPVAKQNAAILIRREARTSSDNIVFEFFETSPTSQKALEAQTALEWDFPGSTVTMTYRNFAHQPFLEQLVTFLEQASKESIKQFAGTTRKAGSGAWESRETTHPALITSVLMTLLEALGERITVPLLRKKVRDDVCWSSGINPWRRNPIWLLLRVGVQRHLQHLLGPQNGTVCYKFLRCVLLRDLMLATYQNIHPEKTTILKAKLCRRMAKIDMDKEKGPSNLRGMYDYLSARFDEPIKKAVTTVTSHIEAEWKDFRFKLERKVTQLPRRADYDNDTRLALQNSLSHLTGILEKPWDFPKSSQARQYSSSVSNEVLSQGRKEFAAFSDPYYKLIDGEQNLRLVSDIIRRSKDNVGIKVSKLSAQLGQYLDSVGNLYHGEFESTSEMILNTLEMWVSIDHYAVEGFPMLRDFHPVFIPDMLDTLRLSRASSLKRLNRIGDHLARRVARAKEWSTIFIDPCKGCFADRYFQEASERNELHKLHEYITDEAEKSRLNKEAEWKALSEEFEIIQQQIVKTACHYYLTNDLPPIQRHNDRGCPKCKLEGKARRMKIRIWENPLPDDDAVARAVVFELGCPPAFAAYRDITWRILRTLAFSNPHTSSEPHLLLKDYTGFANVKTKANTIISLASTKKSFHQTHLAEVSFPTPLEKVCLSNGLGLCYWDSIGKMLPARMPIHPTFQQHFPLPIPESSPFFNYAKTIKPGEPPSSYEVIASQTKCPSGVNVHEFLAYQSLLSGHHRRLPSIMIELASSNINFSSEATTLLIRYLILQVGPRMHGTFLRTVSHVFKDSGFGIQLLDQVEYRLKLISNNRRENHCMETMVLLLCRALDIWREIEFKDKELFVRASTLLNTARSSLRGWIQYLRGEIDNAETVEDSRRFSEAAMWAALLGRATFASHDENQPLAYDELQFFFECSILLQHSLTFKPSEFSSAIRLAFVKDIRISYRIRKGIKSAVKSHPEALAAAFNIGWPQDKDTVYRAPDFVESGGESWIRVMLEGTKIKRAQTVLLHAWEGHLLLDGKPLGQLPPEHRKNPILHILFGNQNLLTIPSRMTGMTYALSRPINHHRVHIGFCGAKLIVRAEFNGTILEYIPVDTFGDCNLGPEDLPASLLDDCVHWLNVTNGILHVRRACWHDRQSDWSVDVHHRYAHRRGVRLVERNTAIHRKVAAIFKGFEHARFLTVFQPAKRNLTVELRRLELKFEVNTKGWLESETLQSFIDDKQDAGTWYGLQSKIVLRDVLNERNRSVIVPLAEPRYQINFPHVLIDVNSGGAYGRYNINTVLGRLDCPPEPRLLFSKALFHAVTSFVLPDPLTGKTGTEEALHCLRSGNCQPWVPLSPNYYPLLQLLAGLTPTRKYYPEGMKVMQDVTWRTDLPMHIQSDHFFSVIQEIVSKSDQLNEFAKEKAIPLVLMQNYPELHQRAKERRSLYERTSAGVELSKCATLPYISRDQPFPHVGASNVFQATRYLQDWSSVIPLPADIAKEIEKWSEIGGFNTSFDKILLSDMLELDLAAHFGQLVHLCRKSSQVDRFKLMFTFALIVYNSGINMDVIRTLIVIATNPALKEFPTPFGDTYLGFKRKPKMKPESLMLLIKPYRTPFQISTLGDLQGSDSFTLNYKLQKKLEAEKAAFTAKVDGECIRVVNHLLSQWPCLVPRLDPSISSGWVDTSQVLPVIQPEWSRLYFNLQLWNYLQNVQSVLNLCSSTSPPPKPMNIVSCATSDIVLTYPSRVDTRITLPELLRSRGPAHRAKSLRTYLEFHERRPEPMNKSSKPLQNKRELDQLGQIIHDLSKSDSVIRQGYAADLQRSLAAFRQVSTKGTATTIKMLPLLISPKIDSYEEEVKNLFKEIKNSLCPGHGFHRWLTVGNLEPCITTVSLLEGLRSSTKLVFGPNMREALTLYGLLITENQRLLRVENLRLRHDITRCTEEEMNPGHENWNPLEYPDWLLLEIDSNIMIRREQVDVANATINPASGENSVLQMNMGQGKTSCIMPMAAAVLADTKRLVRVVVPRALLLQTVQIVHARLGGLVGRGVRHVPFSRQTSTAEAVTQTYLDIHIDIMKSAGLMVCLPEHMLSFMLSGLQRLSDGRLEEARVMVRAQSWLTRTSRDILDESDFTLAVRTQLIYPSGTQKAFDGHPNRWKTAQTLLSLVQSYLPQLRNTLPKSVEVVNRHEGGYPFVFFLRKDAEELLIKWLIRDICFGRTTILPLADSDPKLQKAVKEFISIPKMTVEMTEAIRAEFRDKSALLKTVFLLRGLFVHRILLLTLKKRWNVQYGLHPTRDPVAVPYHAKGVPSEQAEWGHPDVAILFTCLSFYYHGLNLSQLRQSLQFVLQSDDPASEYDRWAHSTESLPGSLREWNSINVEDESQLVDIWSHVRYNIVVINHYLNNFVFPKHAKQFLTKLQASGWDIPLFADEKAVADKNRKLLTTGFSGTNDNKTMLPLTITQRDLPGLSHTSAEVLTYLLHERNRKYVLAADSQHRWREKRLLQEIHNRRIRVLIDAGAQILEVDNFQLVSIWMSIDTEAPAAIYFDNNKPFVLSRNGNKVPLLATPYAEDSAGCLIYLDECHTRGTDLKIPHNAQGALTLGLGQTKDHTVQAAMRLRQLGSTQSIVFFAPPEVHQSICDITQKSYVDSRDVITWLLHQTCAGIEQLQPLYFSQGLDFCRRIQAAVENPRLMDNHAQLDEYLKALKQPEQQTLEQMYKPKQSSRSHIIERPSAAISTFVKELSSRRLGFQDTGEAVQGAALQEVEQEREVAFEVEAVREVQRPVHHTPYKFNGVHSDLFTFIQTGRVVPNSTAYEPAFMALRRTCSLGEKYVINQKATSGLLYVSTEFTKTVIVSGTKFNDNFQRPVNWILYSTLTNIAIIVSPEEAEHLIKKLQSHGDGYNNNESFPVHMLTYAAAINQRMVLFESLKFFTIPALPTDWKPPTRLSTELGVFAGRLYFQYGQLHGLRTFLGLGTADLEVDTASGTTVLTDKPLSFLQDWLMLKRKGQDFLHTPMGYLCQGKELFKTHAFFQNSEARLLEATKDKEDEKDGDDGGGKAMMVHTQWED